jgi:hypothetical protein
MENIKVKGYEHLKRDPRTNAIINTNKSEYNEYIARRDSKEKEQQKIHNLESDVANMKDDLNEIKSLLRSLVNGS